jgi:peroxiredoxin
MAARIKKMAGRVVGGDFSELKIENGKLKMRLRGIIIGVAGLAGMASLAACNSDSDSARLDGQFIGAALQKVYLERVTPGTQTPVVDTVETNDRGEFTFKVAIPDRQPTLFNLRYGAEMVPLLISPREKVNVMSLGDLDGYRVSGSPESGLVSQLHGIMTRGAAALDSIYTNLTLATPGSEQQERIRRDYFNTYLGVKRRQIAFIVENASSLAAVYALSQRLPGDEVLFNGQSDFVYYRMVADSVRTRYPESRYLAALDKELAVRSSQADLQNRLEGEITEVDYPEIELPDMYGQRAKLSSMAGKVIVLDFWSAAETRAAINNAEMKELWSEWADKGLSIYQVSLDTDRSLWVNAVQQQRLPWTTVCDFRGQATAGARMYNINSIPANFVFDRQGNLAGRNLFGDALKQKIEELVR